MNNNWVCADEDPLFNIYCLCVNKKWNRIYCFSKQKKYAIHAELWNHLNKHIQTSTIHDEHQATQTFKYNLKIASRLNIIHFVVIYFLIWFNNTQNTKNGHSVAVCYISPVMTVGYKINGHNSLYVCLTES